jgi:spermidine/putrescine transport system ATP-binding protein
MGAPDGLVEGPSLIAVALRHVSKEFGKVQAVRDVSLQIKQNEFFSLLGPSGCGKTTILRMLGGFERPTRGEVYLSGRLVNDVPPYRRDTNLIFQHLALFPHLDVFDNIAFGLRMKRLSPSVVRQKVLKALELVDLAGFESRQITQLSGGQKQRVAIARALVNEPAVLLLDEPLGSLDLRLRMQMQEELKEIQQRVGTTFIYVTHDQTEALTMSDRIAVMQDGVVEQVGSGREVYETPRTRFVATFLGDSNLFEGRVVAADRDAAIVEIHGARVRALAQPGAQPGASVFVSVRPEHVRVAGKAEVDGDVENWWEARVRAVTFKGAFTEYRLVTPTEQVVLAHVPPRNGTIPVAGDQVMVGWRTAECVVLTE